jgi:hypothetical protein
MGDRDEHAVAVAAAVACRRPVPERNVAFTRMSNLEHAYECFHAAGVEEEIFTAAEWRNAAKVYLRLHKLESRR